TTSARMRRPGSQYDRRTRTSSAFTTPGGSVVRSSLAPPTPGFTRAQAMTSRMPAAYRPAMRPLILRSLLWSQDRSDPGISPVHSSPVEWPGLLSLEAAQRSSIRSEETLHRNRRVLELRLLAGEILLGPDEALQGGKLLPARVDREVGRQCVLLEVEDGERPVREAAPQQNLVVLASSPANSRWRSKISDHT